MPLIAAACANVDGGPNTRACVTTRMNSVTQKIGSAHRSVPSARAASRATEQTGLAPVVVDQDVRVDSDHREIAIRKRLPPATRMRMITSDFRNSHNSR